MIDNNKPNHICHNPNCKFGENGKPKAYYACNTCLRREGTNLWKQWTCSLICYQEWMAQREAEAKAQEQPVVQAEVKAEAPVEKKVEEPVKVVVDDNVAEPDKTNTETKVEVVDDNGKKQTLTYTYTEEKAIKVGEPVGLKNDYDIDFGKKKYNNDNKSHNNKWGKK